MTYTDNEERQIINDIIRSEKEEALEEELLSAMGDIPTAELEKKINDLLKGRKNTKALKADIGCALVEFYKGYVARLCNPKQPADADLGEFLRKMWAWPETYQVPAYERGYDQPCYVTPEGTDGKIDYNRFGDYKKTLGCFIKDFLGGCEAA